MDRSFSNQLDVPEDHAAIREGVRAVVTRFDDEYWLARDDDGEFPRDLRTGAAASLEQIPITPNRIPRR